MTVPHQSAFGSDFFDSIYMRQQQYANFYSNIANEEKKRLREMNKKFDIDGSRKAQEREQLFEKRVNEEEEFIRSREKNQLDLENIRKLDNNSSLQNLYRKTDKDRNKMNYRLKDWSYKMGELRHRLPDQFFFCKELGFNFFSEL